MTSWQRLSTAGAPHLHAQHCEKWRWTTPTKAGSSAQHCSAHLQTAWRHWFNSCGAAASDLSAWLRWTHWAQLRLISLPLQSWALAEFVAFWRCAMGQVCSLVKLQSLGDRKGSSRRGTESSVLVLGVSSRKKWNKTANFSPQVVF